MREKLETALWFARRPAYWAQAVELVRRKLRSDHDRPQNVCQATSWAAERAVSVADALAIIGLDAGAFGPPRLAPALIAEGEILAGNSAVRMGGPGDLQLLYAAALLSGARRVVETGVAYGWSSLAILAALEGREDARLVSVDMPYPKMRNETFVGIVVPARLRGPWQIVCEPDRCGLEKAIARLGGRLDLCHYDSDKSWWGRQYAFPRLWEALIPGGVFISDDIQDNMAFASFVSERGLVFAVTASAGKFVGMARKPHRRLGS